jgi:hypothetical protein
VGACAHRLSDATAGSALDYDLARRQPLHDASGVAFAPRGSRGPVAGHELLTIEVRGRRLVLAPATTTMVFCAVLAMVNLTLNELDRQLTISPIGAGWPPSWPTPEWASWSPGTSRATAATSERAPLVQKSGLGAGPGHPEPRRERARNSIPSKTIMPLDS